MPYLFAFCKNLTNSDNEWKQTSYDAEFRGHYAGIGNTYLTGVKTLGVASTDIFIVQQPFPSWTIDEDIGLNQLSSFCVCDCSEMYLITNIKLLLQTVFLYKLNLLLLKYNILKYMRLFDQKKRSCF